VKLLLDEMYSAGHAEALHDAGIDAVTVTELGLAGRSDPDVFAAAAAGGHILLTENVADFARIAADHLGAGNQHPGVRRTAGRNALVTAVVALADQPLDDRVVFLERSDSA
jgi:Domain of unknown function (DUF5615)